MFSANPHTLGQAWSDSPPSRLRRGASRLTPGGVEYIEEHLDASPTLGLMAAVARLSPSASLSVQKALGKLTNSGGGPPEWPRGCGGSLELILARPKDSAHRTPRPVQGAEASCDRLLNPVLRMSYRTVKADWQAGSFDETLKQTSGVFCCVGQRSWQWFPVPRGLRGSNSPGSDL